MKSDCTEPIGSDVNKPMNAWLNTKGVPINTATQHSAKRSRVENAPVDGSENIQVLSGTTSEVNCPFHSPIKIAGPGPFLVFVSF